MVPDRLSMGKDGAEKKPVLVKQIEIQQGKGI